MVIWLFVLTCCKTKVGIPHRKTRALLSTIMENDPDFVL